jgi:sugar O-acyltransferase (sialic acid O-acetyltransferase NeuD family)
MIKKIIIFGSGDLAEIAHYYLNKTDTYKVVAFTVDKDYLQENTFHNLPVIAFENIEDIYSINEYEMFIPLSYSKMNKIREKKYLQAKKKGYNLISYISPNATIADNVEIGDNCFIFEDNTIQPFVKVQNNCILWSGNHIGHHSIIKSHCFIASQVVISGGCIIEEFCFIGVNATLRDHITVAKKCLIGAGAIIMSNTKPNEVYIPEKTRPYHKNSGEINL